MSDTPERIHITASHDGDTGSWNTTRIDERLGLVQIAYTRSDVAQAMVAAAYEDAANAVESVDGYDNIGGEHPLVTMLRQRANTDARAALDATLAKAREDALREALPVAAALAAAISLLDRTRQQAPSDKMFQQMVADYDRALDDFRALIDRTAERNE